MTIDLGISFPDSHDSLWTVAYRTLPAHVQQLVRHKPGRLVYEQCIAVLSTDLTDGLDGANFELYD